MSSAALSLRICQLLAKRSAPLNENSIAVSTMESDDTRIDVYTCLDGLETCGIIQCKLDEEEEWVYSLSPIWKEHFTKACGGCNHG